jgi:hypothetical protein
LHGARFANVGDLRQHVSPEFANFSGDCPQLALRRGKNGHPGAGLSESQRGRPADAGAAPGNPSDFAL